MRITEEDIKKTESATPDVTITTAGDTSGKKKSRDKDTQYQDLSFKGKIQYLWDYYKWVIVVIAIIIGVIAIIKEAVVNSKKVEVLHIAMIDAILADQDLTLSTAGSNTEQMEKDIVALLGCQDDPHAFAGVDSNLYTDDTGAALDYNSSMVLTVKISAGEYDIVLYPRAVFDTYEDKASFFLPMDEVIPSGDRHKAGQYEDYCITLDDMSYFNTYGFAFSEDMVLTVIANSKNPENAKTFIQAIGY